MNQSQDEENIIANPGRAKAMENAVMPSPAYKTLGITPIMQEFSSLDGDLPEDVNHSENQIIDNNDYVSYPTDLQPKTVKEQLVPKDDSFILMVRDKVVTHGSENQVLLAAQKILYRQDENFANEVSINDILVLKKIKLKIGVFLDEQ